MKIGDLVRHYACGGKLELGVILDIGEFECQVWYPDINLKQWNLKDDLRIIDSWYNMTKKLEKKYENNKRLETL